ncbi:MAG: hypothetical protein H7A23_01680 [Leptospiraceae bacterium]|nr:hypothetical protein [Leptospiraceae bacterium]MCP5493243.1 hypothetical protein [Leptospiraceae bacterium]
MQLIENRNLLLVTLKEPFIEWIFTSNPTLKVSEDKIIHHKAVYLVKDLETITQKSIAHLIKNNYQKIFIHELWSWNTNESLWPETDLSTFNEWLSVEHLEVCYDLLNSPIFKMELFA